MQTTCSGGPAEWAEMEGAGLRGPWSPPTLVFALLDPGQAPAAGRGPLGVGQVGPGRPVSRAQGGSPGGRPPNPMAATL